MDKLKARLRMVGDDVRRNAELRFDELRTPHFLSWSFLPGERDETGAEGPPRLVFEANFPGLTEPFLAELYQELGEKLKEHIYQSCCTPTWSNEENFKDFFRAHASRTTRLFVSYRGLSASKIDNDDKVHWYFHDLLARDATLEAEKAAPTAGSEDERIDRLVQACHLRVQEAIQRRGGGGGPPLDFAFEREPTLERVKKRCLGRLVLALPILPLAVVVLGRLACEVVGTAFEDWRARRMKGEPRPLRPEPDADAKAGEEMQKLIESRENRRAQNHLTHYVELKPGLLRHLSLRLALTMWNYLAKTWFPEGSLAGFEGIHFARWVIVDSGWQRWPPPTKEGRPRRLTLLRKRRGLLFLSNHDGSWEVYLDSFIDRAGLGLTTIWGNTEGFPKTRLRWNDSGKFPYVDIELGAQREEEFKRWVREHQLFTTLWYSRHPDKSVSNIRMNREIRSLSGATLDVPRLKGWLQRL